MEKLLIVGAGFAGIKLARKLSGLPYEIWLIDKNNYHQFPPLFYQVATAGLEPSSISFPLRKLFQGRKNFRIRVADVLSINTLSKELQTAEELIPYDHLVICTGTDSNYFGKQELAEKSLPMKTISEALQIRNSLLQHFEKALVANASEREALMNVLVVGAGPTGVELSGALAEMRSHILPKDYPELDFSRMRICLVEAAQKTLSSMSQEASQHSRKFLEQLGVEVRTGVALEAFDGKEARLSDGSRFDTRNLIWAAGVKGNLFKGLPESCLTAQGRILVDRFHRVSGLEGVYALGDVACMYTEKFPKGHPQVATVANEQAANLAANFKRLRSGKAQRPYEYSNKGSMATIGRHRAVVDLPFIRFQGFLAWFFWMFLHLMLILGVRNKIFIFINWMFKYFTYDQSLRLIIKPSKP